MFVLLLVLLLMLLLLLMPVRKLNSSDRLPSMSTIFY